MIGYRRGLKEREDELRGLRPFRTMYRELSVPEEVGLHYHHALELNWFVGARPTVRVSGKSWSPVGESVVVIPPDAPHSYSIPAGGSVWVVHVSLEAFRDLFSPEFRDSLALGSLDWVGSVPPVHPSYARVLEPFVRLTAPGAGTPDQIAPLCTVLDVLRSVDQVAPSDLKANGPMRRIIEYSEAHWNEPVAIAQVADAAFLSVPHFCRVFRATAGISYVDYLSRLRVEKACARLRAGASVTDACFESGFQNLSYFIQVFRRYIGTTPGRFVRQSGGPLPE